MTPAKARAVVRLMLPLIQPRHIRVPVEAVLDAADAVAADPSAVKAWTARTLQWAMAEAIKDPETLEGNIADAACNAMTATLCEMEGPSQHGLRDTCCELVESVAKRVESWASDAAGYPPGTAYCLAVWVAFSLSDPAEAYRVAKQGLADGGIDDEARAELSRVVEFMEVWLKKRYPHLCENDTPWP